MKNCLLLAMFILLSNTIRAQSEIVNPSGKWYFGAEIGNNKIESFRLSEPNTSLQGGLIAEYYTNRHWSLCGRIKYFKTGVSFDYPSTHTGGWLDLGSDAYHGQFKGATIVLPVAIKWEFRVYRNAAASIKLGYAHSFETKSRYSNYSQNLRTDYPKEYGSLVTGFGFNYFLDQKVALYIDIESYFGGEKAAIPRLIFDDNQYLINNLINLGIKYNFKI